MCALWRETIGTHRDPTTAASSYFPAATDRECDSAMMVAGGSSHCRKQNTRALRFLARVKLGCDDIRARTVADINRNTSNSYIAIRVSLADNVYVPVSRTLRAARSGWKEHLEPVDGPRTESRDKRSLKCAYSFYTDLERIRCDAEVAMRLEFVSD